MELRQLEYLLAVAEEASFTRAAARVHVAQPGVSAQIKQLERELGQDLFDRTGRSVTLTAAGEAVLPFARAALAATRGAREVTEELAELQRGQLAMGMVTGCGGIGVPDLLAAFHDQYPGVEIRLSEDASDKLIDAVNGGSLDVALIGRSGPPAPRLERRIVTDQAIVAAVAPGSRYAGGSQITLAALAELPLICLPRGTGLRSALDDACAAARLTPKVAFEAGDPKILAELARRGLGVAILPEQSIETAAGSLQGIEIVRPKLRGRIELVWRAEGPVSPAARALIAAATEFFSAVAPSELR
jgi:DNA-binding transcriptional LysR family regulator